MSWEEDIRKRITDIRDLPEDFSLLPEEMDFLSRDGKGYMPFSVTKYFLSLSDYGNPDCPIRKQFMPRVEELIVHPLESDDPLFEENYRVFPHMVHRYKNRILVLVTNFCVVNCRYCFRRYYKEQTKDTISREELEKIAGYLSSHSEVREVLLSGGDPLTLSDARIADILGVFRRAKPDIVIRIGSRILSVLPSRVTDELLTVFKKNKPLWFISQFNHPRELTPESRRGIEKIIDAGIPILNQSVLLRGINDSVDTLMDLFNALVGLRIKPYYLFQCDLAAGTSHFRVPIERGFEIMNKLKENLSGIGLPVYALDLPSGGGKISLLSVDVKRDRDSYIIENGDESFIYPV